MGSGIEAFTRLHHAVFLTRSERAVERQGGGGDGDGAAATGTEGGAAATEPKGGAEGAVGAEVEGEAELYVLQLVPSELVWRSRGCVVRLAGLYLEDRGAHNYWLTQDEVAQRSDGLINQIHYRDAANSAVAALLRGSPGSVYVAADDQPLTREQICVEACRAPRFAGRNPPKFTGSEGGIGKVVDSSHTRAALQWQPVHRTFGAFVDTLA